jgi:hypothetical protein
MGQSLSAASLPNVPGEALGLVRNDITGDSSSATWESMAPSVPRRPWVILVPVPLCELWVILSRVLVAPPVPWPMVLVRVVFFRADGDFTVMCAVRPGERPFPFRVETIANRRHNRHRSCYRPDTCREDSASWM